MGSLARVRLHQGQLDDARAIGARAIAMARQQNDPATLATALGALVESPLQPHQTEEALRDATEMVEQAPAPTILKSPSGLISAARFCCSSSAISRVYLPPSMR